MLKVLLGQDGCFTLVWNIDGPRHIQGIQEVIVSKEC